MNIIKKPEGFIEIKNVPSNFPGEMLVFSKNLPTVNITLYFFPIGQSFAMDFFDTDLNDSNNKDLSSGPVLISKSKNGTTAQGRNYVYVLTKSIYQGKTIYLLLIHIDLNSEILCINAYFNQSQSVPDSKEVQDYIFSEITDFLTQTIQNY